jgi:hypothetical protein
VLSTAFSLASLAVAMDLAAVVLMVLGFRG